MRPLLAELDEKLTPLQRSVAIQVKTAEVGFDWPTLKEVFGKLQEEIKELEAELTTADQRRIQDEFGDILFCCANIARWLEIDPEAALSGANQKFEKRFNLVEKFLEESGKDFKDCSFSEMLDVWEKAKSSLKYSTS